MINSQYQTKRRRKRAFAKALTQKDETILPLFVGRTKELEHKPRTFANIFLNGK